MPFAYFPHTDRDIEAMLDRAGLDSLDGLYSDVPEDVLFKGEFDLPDAMTEMIVTMIVTILRRIGNRRADDLSSDPAPEI